MNVIQASRLWLPAALISCAVLWSVVEPGAIELTSDTHAKGDPAALLPGTWLREFAVQGVTTRRILTLGEDYRFREAVRVVEPTGRTEEYVHEGIWSYDGTNLKRKYISTNGQPPSRLTLPFATFQITFDSPREFHGVDHIHGNEIQYRRVPAGTEL
jgi:hypothetical protein